MTQTLPISDPFSRPIDLQASHTAGVVITVVWTGLMGCTFLWSLWMLTSRRNSLPLLMFISGAIAALIEPMVDTLCQLWYPTNNPVIVYKNFGIDIPLFVFAAYVVLGGIAGYGTYLIFKRGATMKQLIVLFVALAGLDMLLEWPATLKNVWTYFGNQPFRLFTYPLWVAISAASCILLIGYLLYLVDKHLSGATKRLAIIMLVPTGVTATYAVDDWPLFLALHANTLTWVVWLTGAVMVTLNIGTGTLIFRQVATDSTGAAYPRIMAETPVANV